MKIGCDLVSISRIKKLCEKHEDKFLDKFLNPSEKALARDNVARIAGFWAAKEAASKALGVGISSECGFFDIILSKDEKGAPKLDFSARIYVKFKISQTSLSISHDSGFAMAVVVLG